MSEIEELYENFPTILKEKLRNKEIEFPSNTKYLMFALWGVIAIAMGAGDYYNVFNALTQMPKGARTYLYQMNSYWYMPENR